MKKLFFYSLIIIFITNCTTKKVIQKGGIAISFDDRFVNEWYQLRPIFKKYNAKVTFYISQPDSLSDEEVKLLHELQNEGHEIGCHSMNHERSVVYVEEHSLKEYMENEIFKAISSMKKQGFLPNTFAHPGGSQSWVSDRELLKIFTLLRDVSMKTRKLYGYEYVQEVEEMNEIYHQHDNTQKVNALLIDTNANLTIEDIQKGLQRAKKEGSIIMLFGHKPLNKINQKSDEYGFDIQFLEQILVESAKLDLKSFTMQEL